MIEAIVIIIAIIVIALAVVMMKPKDSTKAQTANAPEVLDGRKIRRAYGTVWIDDPTVLAWKPMGTIPIKAG